MNYRLYAIHPTQKDPTMDIASFIPKTDTVDIELFAPNGDPLVNADGSPMTITMYLPHSKVAKDVKHEQTNRRIARSQQKKAKAITSQEIEAEVVESLVKTTAGWNITYKGDKPKFSEALATEIYQEAPFIQDQLFEGVAEAAVFTKG